MKKPLKYCVNGDGRPVHPPSWVLCKECFAQLDGKFKALGKTASEYGNDEIRWPDGLQHYSRVQSSNSDEVTENMTINDIEQGRTVITPAGERAKLIRKGQTISRLEIVATGETYAVWNTLPVVSPLVQSPNRGQHPAVVPDRQG